jgi:hypothetical protein
MAQSPEHLLDRLRRAEKLAAVNPWATREILTRVLLGSVTAPGSLPGFAVHVVDGRVLAEFDPAFAAALATILAADADVFVAERGGEAPATPLGRVADLLARGASLAVHPSRAGSVPE